jgi:peptidoglycan lytic transglycosylase
VLKTALLLALLDPSKLGPYAKKGVRGEFLGALGLEEKREFARAAPMFADLVESYPLLAPYHAYHGARCAYFAKQSRLALRLLDLIPADSVLDAEARLLRADTLRALGRDDDATAVYRDYLSRYPNGMRLAEVYFRLGDYRRAYVLGTTTPWAERAAEHFDPAGLTADERLQRAGILYDAMRNQEAEAAFVDVLQAPGLTPAAECTARFSRAETAFRQRTRDRAAPLYDEAAAACERAGNEDLRVRALYQAGRCLPPAEAVKRFRLVEATRHSYADDARLREAESAADAGDAKAATDLLASIPDAYPDGDMVGEALWRLARDAIDEKRFADALGWLDRALEKVPRETDFWAEGRTLYWRGRVLVELDRDDDARASFIRCAQDYPLTWYALLALDRLGERFPGAARALEHDLLGPVPAHPRPLAFTDRPLFSTPGFRRAVELIRLGLGRDAQRELQAAGVTPGGKEEDSLWLAAALYDRAGRWRDAHWIPRHTLTGYKVSYPHGSNAARWRLAYPRGFGSLVDREAKKNGIPAALLYAIVREESAFDPDVESWANAVGLAQLLLPTARRFSDGTRVTPESLRRPEINLRIGARFLGFLWKRYDGAAPLVAAGYNAGENAVDRWLRERGPEDLDLFVEKIPFDQTRRYTKRVMSSYFAYRALEGGASAPRLPLRTDRADRADAGADKPRPLPRPRG